MIEQHIAKGKVIFIYLLKKCFKYKIKGILINEVKYTIIKKYFDKGVVGTDYSVIKSTYW